MRNDVPKETVDFVRNLTLPSPDWAERLNGTALSELDKPWASPVKELVRLIIHSVASEGGTLIFARNAIVRIDPLG